MKQFLSNIQKNATAAAMGAVGGAGGRVLTNQVATKIPFLKDNPKLQPALAFVLGAGLMGTKSMQSIGFGMAATAGADIIGSFVPMTKPINALDDLSLADFTEELSDELEERLSDDVANVQAAMNGDDDYENMNGEDDYINGEEEEELGEDVSNPATNMNGM